MRTYSELQRELAEVRKRDSELCKQLDHVRGVLRLYRPDMPLAPISPTRLTKRRKLTPRGGKQSSMALEVLRDTTEPLTTRDIARRVLQRQGYPDPDARMIGMIVPNVHGALARCEKRETVKQSGKPRRWQVIDSK
jgi:hypothetical protein